MLYRKLRPNTTDRVEYYILTVEGPFQIIMEGLCSKRIPVGATKITLRELPEKYAEVVHAFTAGGHVVVSAVPFEML